MKGFGLALTLLDLAFIVTCVGLAYRYVTQSSARLYARTLRDLIGSWADELLGSSLTADLRLRGPFQLTNILLPKMQLPMSQDEFIAAFERVAPGLYGEALAILGRRDADSEWKRFVERLHKEGKNNPQAQDITKVIKGVESERQGSLVKPFGEPHTHDLSLIRAALWRLFPDINDLISRYDDFLTKFNYANRRRNLRQLTLFAGLVTLCGNLTFARLFNADSLPAGTSLFDTQMTRTIPGLLWHREFVAILKYVAWCVPPALTIAGLADVFDRKLFGGANMDFVVPSIQRAKQGEKKGLGGRSLDPEG